MLNCVCKYLNYLVGIDSGSVSRAILKWAPSRKRQIPKGCINLPASISNIKIKEYQNIKSLNKWQRLLSVTCLLFSDGGLN